MLAIGAQPVGARDIAQDPEGVVSSAVAWVSRTSVLLGDWMLTYNISAHAMTSLVKDVLPAASQAGSLKISDLASDGRAVMNQMAESLSQFQVAAQRETAIVCVKCGWPARQGVLLQSSAMCGNCPGTSYRQLHYVRWPLKEQIAARLQEETFAIHLLDHLQPTEGSNSALCSPRALELRDILASKCGFDSPLNCGLGLHVDGWCPFDTRPNDSCTYILADLLTGASLRTDRVSILPWFLDEGPGHCKSTEPFRRQLVQEARELAQGVEMYWPLDVDVNYKGEVPANTRAELTVLHYVTAGWLAGLAP